MSANLVLKGKITSQWEGKRDILDHFPIWLKSSDKDWCPKPFKFKNCWIKHKEFGEFIKEEWKKIVVEGRCDFRLKEKLKTFEGEVKVMEQSSFQLDKLECG